jgi:hypothetical protein
MLWLMDLFANQIHFRIASNESHVMIQVFIHTLCLISFLKFSDNSWKVIISHNYEIYFLQGSIFFILDLTFVWLWVQNLWAIAGHEWWIFRGHVGQVWKWKSWIAQPYRTLCTDTHKVPRGCLTSSNSCRAP